MLFYSSENNRIDKAAIERAKKEEDFKGADPRIVYGKNWNNSIQRPRICPICGRALKKTEFLYASMFDSPNPNLKKQVHIYGCKFCYLGKAEEGSETPQEESSPEEITESLDI